MKKIFLFTVAAATVFTACKKDGDDNKAGIFKGPEVQVHNGKAWTWVQINNSGNPERLAITLTDAALNSVPAGDGHSHDHGHENSWVLQFHPKAAVTPFNHVGMGWNPDGHEPEPIYGKPHFDFHFYMMTPGEVAAIPPYEADSLKFKNWPAPSYFPLNYFNAGGGVPQMGAHWVDLTSGEFNGQEFTQTFIYGSYDGKVTFYEPMITLDFLKNNSNFERAIPEPAKVQKTGYYPTKLKVVKHDGVTEIILDAFVYKVQS
ncbi:MAG TPA: hypothetical protein VI461_12040 [Chitinophagaceae bacterium]|nr:hypothetical protein [Chitinophagaceae bacterium]